MTQVGVREIKAVFSEYLNRAAYAGERVVIMSRGKPKAALISIEDLRRLEELEGEHEAAMLTRAIAEETTFYTVAEVEARLADRDADE